MEILKAIHALWKAKMHFRLFCLSKDVTNEKVKRQFLNYVSRIEWVINDIRLHPQCSDEIRQAIDVEWQGDVLVFDSVQEKMLLLTPKERETIEMILDAFIAGESINVVNHKNDNDAS